MGARKFTLRSTANWMLASAENNQQLSRANLHRTAEQQNINSQAYNAKLQGLIARFQANLVGARYAYVDIYNPFMDVLQNHYRYGIYETIRGCSGTGLIEMGGLCSDSAPTCPDALRSVFWDAVHPTGATYRILANNFNAAVLPHLIN